MTFMGGGRRWKTAARSTAARSMARRDRVGDQRGPAAGNGCGGQRRTTAAAAAAASTEDRCDLLPFAGKSNSYVLSRTLLIVKNPPSLPERGTP